MSHQIRAADFMPARSMVITTNGMFRNRTNPYVPPELSMDPKISVAAKGVYVVLQTADPRSFSDLSGLTGLTWRKARSLCRELAASGWLKLVRLYRGMEFELTMPPDVMTRYLQRMKWKILTAAYRDEAKMKAWLDLLVWDDDYVDNTRPDFLRNPATDWPMELDRCYRVGVAFEFHGTQHYEETEWFDAKKVREQRGRDLMKQGLCAENGIKLIIIVRTDLTYEGMNAKLPDSLPRARVKPDDPRVKFLNSLAYPHQEI